MGKTKRRRKPPPRPKRKPNRGQKVGSATQGCPPKKSGLTVFVRERHTNKPLGRVAVRLIGPTPSRKKTKPKGYAGFQPINGGRYTIHITLPKDIVARYKKPVDLKTTVPHGVITSRTIYVEPLAKLRAKLVIKRRRPNPAGGFRQVTEPLTGAQIRVEQLNLVKPSPGAGQWADFGIVKPGSYTAVVSDWGTHAGKYTLVGGIGKTATARSGRVTSIVLEAVPTGWIEFETVWDKPKTGQKAQIQNVTLKIKRPDNSKVDRPTGANGVVRIEQLEPGHCDVEEASYTEAIEVVSD